MQAASYRQPHTCILYDADRLERPGVNWFSPDHWAQYGDVDTFRHGRGGCWRIGMSTGSAVLKHYRRGGQMARLSFDRYLFTGWERSRGFLEWRLLAHLCAEGLPVPEPLAALCIRAGRSYRAALISRYIEGAVGLQHLLINDVPNLPELALKTGQLLALFHSADVNHVDLNVNNIVKDHEGRLWLLDFDRGQLVRMTKKKRQKALQRLQRSLHKLAVKEQMTEVITDSFWKRLQAAYWEA